MATARVRRATLGAVLAAKLLLAGCGGAMSEATHAYDEARYPDAVAELHAIEGEASEWTGERRARYALYRGLAHLAVGDARQADRFLVEAKRTVDRSPELLSDEDRGRLLAAWRSMGRMSGETR